MRESYGGEHADELPIGAYAVLMSFYVLVFGGALRRAARRGRLPIAIGSRDIFLLGVATHRLSRILTRDKVAAPLRMPFTRYEEPGGAGEVKEQPRGRGLRRALGNLLTCQFCAGPWIAGTLVTALLLRPRETRTVSAGLSIVTVADFLHQLYAFARRSSG